jgi:hypothetical protein
VTLGRNLKGSDLKTNVGFLLVDVDLDLFEGITERFPEKLGGIIISSTPWAPFITTREESVPA